MFTNGMDVGLSDKFTIFDGIKQNALFVKQHDYV